MRCQGGFLGKAPLNLAATFEGTQDNPKSIVSTNRKYKIGGIK